MGNISKIYSGKGETTDVAPTSDKNPNRVLGGIRGSGSDVLTIVTEEGVEQRLPSMRYVKGLELKVTDLNNKVMQLERIINQLQLQVRK